MKNGKIIDHRRKYSKIFGVSIVALFFVISGLVLLAAPVQAGGYDCGDDNTPPDVYVEFGEPKIWASGTEGQRWLIGPNTPVWINATDDESGVDYIRYTHDVGVWERVDDGDPEDLDPTTNISVVIYFNDYSCWHEIDYEAYDNCGNYNGINAVDFYVDIDPPTTTYVLLEPNIPITGPPENWCWIGNCTWKWINSTDTGCIPGGVGVEILYIEIATNQTINGKWKIQRTFEIKDNDPVGDGPYKDLDDTLGVVKTKIHINESCWHWIKHWAIDKLGNLELAYPGTHKQVHKVDAVAPMTHLEYMGDSCENDEGVCVTTDTTISIITVNVGEEPCIYPDTMTFFRVFVPGEGWYPDENGQGSYYSYGPSSVEYWKDIYWYRYHECPKLKLTEECKHYVEYFAKDPLCNTEETNNETIFVDEQAPYIEKIVNEENCYQGLIYESIFGEDVDTWCVRGDTEIEIDAWDLGCCDKLEYVGYRVWYDGGWNGWNDITTAVLDDIYTFNFGDVECKHLLQIKAKDCLGNIAYDNETFYVDNQKPTLIKTVGDPKCDHTDDECECLDEGDYCVTTDTTVTLEATENGCCLDTGVTIEYMINPKLPTGGYGWTGWQTYTMSFKFPEECEHQLIVRAYDCLKNGWDDGDWDYEIFYVNDSSPEIEKIVGTPNCTGVSGADYCVRTTTPIWLWVHYDSCCPCEVTFEYRVWNETGFDTGWSEVPYNGWDFHFETECFHHLDLRATDCFGNMVYHNETFFVDDQAPEFIKTVGDPKCDHTDDECECLDEGDYCVTTETYITLQLIPKGCCPSDFLEYRIDSWNGEAWDIGTWTPYTVQFNFPDECKHRLVIRAYDCLKNGYDDAFWDYEIFYVNDQEPWIEKIVGIPNCPDPDGADYCVTTGTQIKLKVHYDSCCPCDATYEYRVWNESGADTGWLDFSSLNDLGCGWYEFYFDDECFHHLDLKAYDCLGHITYHNETFYVDDTYPRIVKEVGDPNCDGGVSNSGLKNPGFETGDLTYWQIESQVDSVSVVTNDGFTSPLYGKYMARLGDDNGGVGGSQPIGDNKISQVFTADGNTFSFAYNIFTYDYTGLNHFSYVLETADGVTTIASYSQGAWGSGTALKSTGWQTVSIDISGYSGQQLKFTINCGGTSDQAYPTWAYVDAHVDKWCVTTETDITINAYDLGCCPSLTVKYRVWNGPNEPGDDHDTGWVDITTLPFVYNFQSECFHHLDIKAYDCLGHVVYDNETFYVDDTYPVIDKKVGEPNCTGVEGADYCVTTDTSIYLKAWDEGCCPYPIVFEYRVWNDTYSSGWLNVADNLYEEPCGAYVGYYIFKFEEECFHNLDLRAYDCLGHITYHNETFYVDDQAPYIDKTVGDPNIPVVGDNPGDYWVSCDTPITIDAWDQGCCNNLTYVGYRIKINDDEWGPWQDITTYILNVGPKTIYFTESCVHTLEIKAMDCLENTREDVEIFYVDCSAPESNKELIGPTYHEDLNGNGTIDNDEELYYWLRDNDTIVKISSYDQEEYPCMVGVKYLHVELWWDSNNNSVIEPGELLWSEDIEDESENDSDGDIGQVRYQFKIMEDCLHKIVWYAVDLFDNKEDDHVQYHRVDSQPPKTTKYIGEPKWWDEDKGLWWVTSDTEFSLVSVDEKAPCDVGVDYLEVTLEHSCYNGSYNYYNDYTIEDNDGVYDLDDEPGVIRFNFTLPRECWWKITWHAVDFLTNGLALEDWHVQYHVVDNTPPHVIIIKPTDGWYSDGESIPTVAFAEDIQGPHGYCGMGYDCAVGIGEGSEGKACIIDIFPEPKIISLDATNFVYDEESHEYIGNVVIPENTGINGTVLFVVGVEDRLGNDWNSLLELVHTYILQAIAECYFDECCVVELLADWLADFVADQNIVFIGIDNIPPEINITLPTNGQDVGLGPIHLEADIVDTLSGVVTGTPCYVTLDGISLPPLYYDSGIGGCVGDLSIPVEVLDGPQNLVLTVADRAGCMGSDNVTVLVGARPGPTTSGTDVMPECSIIGTELEVTATTFSTIAFIADADFYVVDFWGNTVLTGNMDPSDGAFDETSENINTTLDTTGWEAGEYTIYVRGQDDFGRWGAYDEEEFSLVEEAMWRPVVCNILFPEWDEFEVECDQKYIEVVVQAYRPAYNGMPKDYNLDVTIWLDQPYGAPDLFYPVTDEGDGYFTAEIPIYCYHSGSELNLEAKAEDEYGNRAYDDTTFVVISNIEYDIWLEEGWNGPINLAVLGCDNSTLSVFASIDPYWDFVFEVGTWDSYWYNMEEEFMNGGPLQHILIDGWYWIHMTEAARFYIDNTCPEVSVEYPEDEEVFYNECLEGDIWGFACDLETSVVEVTLVVYDDDTGEYWNGTAWVETETILPCVYDDVNNDWYCENTEEIDLTYKCGHTIILTATATDMGGCTCSDTIWFMFIDDNDPYVEVTYPEDEAVYDNCMEPYEITGFAYDGECETIVTDVYITIKDWTADAWWTGTGWGDETNLSCDYNPDPMSHAWEFTDIPEWEDGHDYSVYAYADDACGNTGESDEVFFTYICEPECEPCVEVEKSVWDGCCWADSTEVEEGATVTFNITIYVPEDGCNLCGGNASDFLPTGLIYIPETTNITVHYMGTTFYVEIEPSQIPYSGGTILLWSEDEFGTPMELPAGMLLYIEFNATVDECGEYNNTVILTTYECDNGCCPITDEDWAWVIVPCEECTPSYAMWKYTWCHVYEDWYNSYGYARQDDNYARFKIEFFVTGECPIVGDIYIRDELPENVTYDGNHHIEYPEGLTLTASYYDPATHAMYFNFIGTLEPDEQIVIEFNASYTGDFCGQYSEVNTAYGSTSMPSTTEVSDESIIYYNWWET